MGKNDNRRGSDFDDIRTVFDKRDRDRASGRPSPGDYPDVPEFMNAPRRTGGRYSVDAMRQAHERQTASPQQPNVVVSHDRRGDAYREAQPDPYYGQDPYGMQPDGEGPAPRREPGESKKKKKKHPVLRWFLRLSGILLALILVFILGSILLAKMPESDDAPWPRKDGCATILLCGTDESGDRTDTMLLLFLDRPNRTMRLLSLPRDTMVNRDNPVPKLNGAYTANGRDEKGMNVLLDYVKDLVGYRPDGYMLIDLDCFEELVDDMGGVEFDVPMDMQYEDSSQDLYIDLKKGPQRLNGKQAMWLVRFRSGYAMADLERVRVQRDFLAAALDQWASPSKIFRLPGAMSLLMKNTQTDLGYRNLCWIGLTALKCGGSFESDTLPGEPAWVNGGAYYVEDRQAAAELVNEKYNPYEKEIRADELHPYGY